MNPLFPSEFSGGKANLSYTKAELSTVFAGYPQGFWFLEKKN